MLPAFYHSSKPTHCLLPMTISPKSNSSQGARGIQKTKWRNQIPDCNKRNKGRGESILEWKIQGTGEGCETEHSWQQPPLLSVPQELMDAAKRWSGQEQTHHYQKQCTELDSTSGTELALPFNPLRNVLGQHNQAKKNRSYALLIFCTVSSVQSWSELTAKLSLQTPLF